MSPTPTLAPDAHAPRIAIVGLGACLPDAPDVATFWRNILDNHVAIKEVPPDRWSQAIYYDPDRVHMDRTYSRIGGFITYDPFDPRRFRLMPRSLPAIDDIQKFSLVAVAEALADAKLRVFAHDTEGRTFDRERCAVILGNAMGGEAEDRSSLRVWLLEVLDEMQKSAQQSGLDAEAARALADATLKLYGPKLPKVSEDTMPGELSNCIAGRITNVFDLQGPNFTTDAACASSFAALEAGVRGLQNGDFDMAIVGGADRSMDPPTFVKFSRIGALSGQHSAPFDAEANGFVMGEGVGVVVIKRLEDAQRDGDDIKAVICGVGGSSDGRGKALTAPNPRGQKLAVERAWRQANMPLSSAGLIEAHGTGTPVGDNVEAEVLTSLLEEAQYNGAPVPIGSVKSMIGHLKSAAGAAALIKTTLALRHGMLPPSANFRRVKDGSPLERGKLVVNDRARPWPEGAGPRRAGVSAFGFGGTNFHVVLEEAPRPVGSRQAIGLPHSQAQQVKSAPATAAAAPRSMVALHEQVVALFADKTGYDRSELDNDHELEADLGIDSVKQAEILAVLRERFGVADEARVALSELNTINKVVAYLAAEGRQNATAATAAPVASSSAQQAVPTAAPVASAKSSAPMSGPQVFAFGGATRDEVLAKAHALLQAGEPTALARARDEAPSATVRLAFAAASLEDARVRAQQAASLSARLLSARGIFLAEGEGLARHGKMAFIFPGQGSQYLGMLQDLAAQFPVVQKTFDEADEALRPHLNGKLTDIVWPQGREQAQEEELKQTQNCQPAMLTADVALARLLNTFGVKPDVVAGHSLGEYAAAVIAGVLPFADALYAVSARGREMANVKVDDPGRMAMVAAPSHVVEATLASIDGYVIAANKNCFTQTVIAGATKAVDAAIEAFAKAGIEARGIAVSHAFHSSIVAPAAEPLVRVLAKLNIQAPTLPLSSNVDAQYYSSDRASILERLSKQLASPVQFIDQVQRLYADGARVFVECGPKRATTGFVRNILGDKPMRALASNHPKRPALDMVMELLAALTAEGVAVSYQAPAAEATPRELAVESLSTSTASLSTTKQSASSAGGYPQAPHDDAIVISGVSVLVPNGHAVAPWQDDTIDILLRGENCIGRLDEQTREAIQQKRIVRLEKTHGRFVEVKDASQVPQLAGQLGELPIEAWGVAPTIADALDTTGRLAVASGIDALRDAGLPLVEHMRSTSTGTLLKDRMGLPRAIGARTGVILASAFPNLEAVLQEAQKYSAQSNESFDRKWLFRALPMGHAQLAQVVLAQGPSAQVNAACASGTQALGMAADWIRLGRCDRVIVVTADDVTAQASLPWIGAGFLAAGAASTEADIDRAAAPFQAHRNGMLLGSGAATFVVERQREVAQRGMTAIAELQACEFANSAFHATRLDGSFISQFLARLIDQLPEGDTDAGRQALAHQLAFLSHETYTPARGGSAAAEVEALRHVFGHAAKDVLIANTKGHTGHPMGASFEDVVAIKGLQRQVLPPVANLREPDPAFADLHFAKGGAVSARYAVRFAAGFGSQVAAAAYGRVATQEARLHDVSQYQAWCESLGLGRDARFEVQHRQLQQVAQGGRPIDELGIASLTRPQSVANAQPAHHAVAPSIESQRSASKAPSTASAPTNAINESAMLEQLTALFAEHTGYATEELHPDHAIEADLGVDSVKQAEVLAIVRERYNIGQDRPLVLAELQTLRAMAQAVAKVVAPTTASTPDTPSTRAGHEEEPIPTTVTASPAPSPEPAGDAASSDQILDEITALFAEETGYDIAELQPDHALEADLGIDSIKQAELMAKMRESYKLGEDPAFRLADAQTLRGLTTYVMQRRGVTASTNDKSHASVTTSEAPVGDSITESTPAKASAAPQTWQGPLVTEAASARRVSLFPQPAPVATKDGRELLTFALASEGPSKWTSCWQTMGAVAAEANTVSTQAAHLLVDATGSKPATNATSLSLSDALFAQARQWAQSDRRPQSVCVVVEGDGFGFFAEGKSSPHEVAEAAAIAGIVKSLAREWPETRFDVVSVVRRSVSKAELHRVASAIWQLANAERSASTPNEWVLNASHAQSMQWLTPARIALPEQASDSPLASDNLLVATGGARGVTFALVEALAKRRPLDIVLLARSRGFNDGEDVLQGASDDARRAHAKEVLSQSSARVTPAMVKMWLASYDARREVTDNIQTLKALGSRVEHVICDVSDQQSREQAVVAIQSRNKPVAMLLHGAGIEESRFVKDKAPEDYGRIASPKYDALVALVDLLQPSRIISMGSIAGRFGNAGQTDYAAANNAVAAMARVSKHSMLNIAWTAWDGAAWRHADPSAACWRGMEFRCCLWLTASPSALRC